MRSWVEIEDGYNQLEEANVDLFVRSWVEMLKYTVERGMPMSTSSWGRELKYFLTVFAFLRQGRPLREVVSWNLYNIIRIRPFRRRPLREVVSWNRFRRKIQTEENGRPLREVVSWNVCWSLRILLNLKSTSSWGRELKCCRTPQFFRLSMSTSSWGRELKYCHMEKRDIYKAGRPLREVVSWNFSSSTLCWHLLMSTSSWGRELK